MCPCASNEFEWIKNGRSRPAPRENQSWPERFVSVLLPPGFEACAKTLHGIRANDPAEPYLQRANSGLLTDGHLTLQRVSDLAVCDAPTMEV